MKVIFKNNVLNIILFICFGIMLYRACVKEQTIHAALYGAVVGVYYTTICYQLAKNFKEHKAEKELNEVTKESYGKDS